MENEIAEKKNYQAVRYNAVKHGILSRHTVLPDEDREEYQTLLSQLEEEHNPTGPTEFHLVEELAGVIWRKRRVLMAEGATINRGTLAVVNKEPLSFEASTIEAAVPLKGGLGDKVAKLKEMVTATAEEIALQRKIADRDLQATEKALSILLTNGKDRYKKAVDVLQQDSREWWQELLDDGEYTVDESGLKMFLYSQLLPLCRSIQNSISSQPAILVQTLGEGLQPSRLEKLSRYETHLDRKFERALAMPLKMKEMR
jgi:hypothetical protein